MQSRIAKETENKKIHKIKLLNLDNCVSSSIEGLTYDFFGLIKLTMRNVGLTSLEKLPKLNNLRKLEVSDNKISGGLKFLKSCPNLTKLNLSSNQIKNFNELRPLKNLKKLKVLDLYNNQVQMCRYFRERIFYLIPSLQYLDGFDKFDKEYPSDQNEDYNLAYSFDEELTSDGEGDMEHEFPKHFNSDSYEGSASDGSSNSDKTSNENTYSSSSTPDKSDSSSWEDMSLDENSSSSHDTSKDEWVDVSSDDDD